VIDYVLYQRVFMSHIENSDDYIRALGSSYAEDPKYEKKLKTLINQN
jgi:flagellum-specific peptidoglycan hydrolase FlgJ